MLLATSLALAGTTARAQSDEPPAAEPPAAAPTALVPLAGEPSILDLVPVPVDPTSADGSGLPIGDLAAAFADRRWFLPDDVVARAVSDAGATPLTALQRQEPGATTAVLATRLDTSRLALGDAIRPRTSPIVPATKAVPTSVSGRPIDVRRASLSDAGEVATIEGQTFNLFADGLPAPAAPSSDPAVRVLPQAVDPNAVSLGARWTSEDRIPAPVLDQINWQAQAGIVAGPPPYAPSGTTVRSLRITAQWDDLEDLSLGLTPGVQRTGGTIFEHYVTGLQASTDPTRDARWRSFIEVSGEKISTSNLIDNSTARVSAGATWQATRSTSVDLAVNRGTMLRPDTSSSVGVSVKF